MSEPVCWWNGKFYTCVKKEVGYDIPLYTAPPSVDALIALLEDMLESDAQMGRITDKQVERATELIERSKR